MKPRVARLWDFSRNATIWIIWISRSLNVGSLKKKKHNTTKHTDKTKHVCRLGLAVGPPVCNLWQRSRDLHYGLERLRMSSRAGGRFPREKSAKSLEREFGSRLWIILNVILFYPFWRRKCFQFAVHFFLLWNRNPACQQAFCKPCLCQEREGLSPSSSEDLFLCSGIQTL